jgi:predicted short-subunit dehydrogenase-like oxidoreductase (DUF2520 family)
VVGAGRLGTAVVAALQDAGVAVSGPHGRGYDGAGDALVLLCVPDDAISAAAATVGPGPLVGHCSGASGLDALGAREAFSLHPLMTVTHDGADFAGVFAAVSGSTPRAAAVAAALAATLRLRPVQVAEADRVAYHAAAAFAANFLVTVESAAAELMSTAGLDREVLLPLARAALENWARQGPTALTGPIARGDQRTVARHRATVERRTPELLPLFEALATATERLADANRAGPRPPAAHQSALEQPAPHQRVPEPTASGQREAHQRQTDRPGSDRPGSDRPGSDRPGSDRPRPDRPGFDQPVSHPSVAHESASDGIGSPGSIAAPQTSESTTS